MIGHLVTSALVRTSLVIADSMHHPRALAHGELSRFHGTPYDSGLAPAHRVR
jgi:hypothetical protein